MLKIFKAKKYQTKSAEINNILQRHNNTTDYESVVSYIAKSDLQTWNYVLYVRCWVCVGMIH